jgi:transcriptional regulator with XRE-family HTH domain
LQDRRANAGLTQEALAGRLGCGRSLIAQWETARAEPPLRWIRALARAFNLPVSHVAGPLLTLEG